MQTSLEWKNKSVLAFAVDSDPIEKMEHLAQERVLEAISNGWSGPPFDPLQLASLMGIRVRPNAAIPDARILMDGTRKVIEFNPNKSMARVNFSIAHEIAHTFFADWDERPRNRSKQGGDNQNWQLEMLCNIGAAEILMPLGTFGQGDDDQLSIHKVLELRKRFNVSTEAVLIRLAKVSKEPVLTFAASSTNGSVNGAYRIDYSIPSILWEKGKLDGLYLKSSTALEQCVAIGNTVKMVESWPGLSSPVVVQAVGLPPYPGNDSLRFAGFIAPCEHTSKSINTEIEFRYGDASFPILERNVAILHVVNDKARKWGGGGFAKSLYRSFPEAAEEYANWTTLGAGFRLGGYHEFTNSANQSVISIVAQHGYGPSRNPRVRYRALHSALQDVAGSLLEKGISTVQMPRIGSGQAGGNWTVIEGMIFEELVLRGIDVKVFDLPPR